MQRSNDAEEREQKTKRKEFGSLRMITSSAYIHAQ